MNWKEFFKPNVEKIILSIILFVIVRYISFNFGITLSCGFANHKPVFDGCRYKLNPLLWLPIPILTGDYEAVAGGGVPASFTVYNMSIIFITFPYWILISYLLSCMVISLRNLIQQRY